MKLIKNDNFMHKILRSVISGVITIFTVYLLLGNFISDIILNEGISDEVFNFLAIVFTVLIAILTFKDIRFL